MAKTKRQRFDGVVYSTNDEYQYLEKEDVEEISLAPSKQNLRISLDKKQRGGKTVTLITGFIGGKEELESLGKLVKQKCGVGGSVKDGVIIIQGDFKVRILELLIKEGYRAKVSGG